MDFPPQIQKLIDICNEEGVTFKEGSAKRKYLFVRNIDEEDGKKILAGNMPTNIEIEVRDRFKPLFGSAMFVTFPLDDEGNLAKREGKYKGKSSLFIQWT